MNEASDEHSERFYQKLEARMTQEWQTYTKHADKILLVFKLGNGGQVSMKEDTKVILAKKNIKLIIFTLHFCFMWYWF